MKKKHEDLKLNSFHEQVVMERPELIEQFAAMASLLMGAKGLKKECGTPITYLLLGTVDLHIKQKYDGYPLTEEKAQEIVKPLVLMLTSGVVGRSVQ